MKRTMIVTAFLIGISVMASAQEKTGGVSDKTTIKHTEPTKAELQKEIAAKKAQEEIEAGKTDKERAAAAKQRELELSGSLETKKEMDQTKLEKAASESTEAKQAEVAPVKPERSRKPAQQKKKKVY